MAIALVGGADRYHASQASTAVSQTSTAFTPSNGNVLVVLIDILLLTTDLIAAGSMLSDTFADSGGGAWTQLKLQDQVYGGTFTAREAIYARSVGSGAASGTITVTATANAGKGVEQDTTIYELSGAASTAAQTINGHGASNTVTVSLPSAPASTSILLATCRADTAANLITTPTGWTASQSVTDANGDTHFTGYKLTSGTQSNAFTTTSSGGNSGIDVVLVEIATAAAPGAPVDTAVKMVNQSIMRASYY